MNRRQAIRRLADRRVDASWAAGVLLLVGTLCLMAGALWLTTMTPPAAHMLVAPVHTRYTSIGHAAVTRRYNLLVKSMRIDDVGDKTYRPGTGYRYVVVDVRMVNKMHQPMALAPVVQSSLVDSAGVHYGMAPTTLRSPFEAGLLPAGELREGELSFNVPQSAKGLRLEYNPGAAGFEAISVDLGL